LYFCLNNLYALHNLWAVLSMSIREKRY
jgi:hypothetical protein